MVKIIYLASKYDKKILLSESVLNSFKKEGVKRIGLFASVQFIELEDVKKQLEEAGIEIVNEENQILGCDFYFLNKSLFFEDCDSILYIGDGLFHPKVLLWSQLGYKMKKVLCFNPKTGTIIEKGFEDIKKDILKLKSNLMKFIGSKSIGIFVSIKKGQINLENSLKLKNKLEKEGKKVYVFIDSFFNFDLIENFNFIDFWINSACPRIGFDDMKNLSKPLINLFEADNYLEILEKLNKTLELNEKPIN